MSVPRANIHAFAREQAARIDAVGDLHRLHRELEATAEDARKLISVTPVIYGLTVGVIDRRIEAYEKNLLSAGCKMEPVDLKAAHIALGQLRAIRAEFMIPYPGTPAMPSPNPEGGK